MKFWEILNQKQFYSFVKTENRCVGLSSQNGRINSVSVLKEDLTKISKKSDVTVPTFEVAQSSRSYRCSSILRIISSSSMIHMIVTF
jgi:hypothetical protein